MDHLDKVMIQKIYYRVCRDSGYTFDPVGAARFTATIVKCDPLEVWVVLGWSNMEQIATGKLIPVWPE